MVEGWRNFGWVVELHSRQCMDFTVALSSLRGWPNM